MPELKNTKHELFAQALAKGKTQIEAYVEAGYQPNDGNAAKTANRDDVQARVKEITGKGAELAALTVAQLIAEADQNRRIALACETPQCSAAMAATKFKAEISDVRVNRIQASRIWPDEVSI